MILNHGRADLIGVYNDVGVKSIFAPDSDTQHAHSMCNVLLKHFIGILNVKTLIRGGIYDR